MKIQFVKDCGHRKEGAVEDFAFPHADQYVVSGFAVPYVEPVPDPEPPAEEEKGPLSEKVVEALKNAGYVDMLDVLLASDEDLLAINGIGKSTLEKIRELGEPIKNEEE